MTKLDLMEETENILQEKIHHIEEEIESIGGRNGPEICQLRMMYTMDMMQARQILMGLRRRLDAEYAARAREREFHDEIANFGKMPGADAGDKEDQQRGEQEPAAGRRAGRRVRHVRLNGSEHPGHDEGKEVRTLKAWQIRVMLRDRDRENLK